MFGKPTQIKHFEKDLENLVVEITLTNDKKFLKTLKGKYYILYGGKRLIAYTATELLRDLLCEDYIQTDDKTLIKSDHIVSVKIIEKSEYIIKFTRKEEYPLFATLPECTYTLIDDK